MSKNVTRVYVGNLGSNGNKSEIEREFSKFGLVRDVWVARNPTGFAFVEFDDIRDADDAIKELNGRRVCGVKVIVQLSSNQGRTSRKPPPSNRGRSRYSPDDRYHDRYGPPRGRYDDDRYEREPRSRRRERLPEYERNPRRYSRSRSRSPPRY